MVQARQHVVPQSKQPNSWSSLGTSCPPPHRPSIDGAVPLFIRSQTGLALSAAGRAFRPHAEQLLHAVALARQAVHDLRPASGGALQLAAALSICTYVLPDVLKRFQAAHPKVMITVRSGHPKEVLEMVLGSQAGHGSARSLQHPEVETLSLRDDPLVLVARPDSHVVRTRRGPPGGVGAPPPVLFPRGARASPPPPPALPPARLPRTAPS